MIKNLEWEWEQLDENTHRAKVFGGWIVKHFSYVMKGENVTYCAESMVFVSNVNHDWVIKKPTPLSEMPESVSKGF